MRPRQCCAGLLLRDLLNELLLLLRLTSSSLSLHSGAQMPLQETEEVVRCLRDCILSLRHRFSRLPCAHQGVCVCVCVCYKVDSKRHRNRSAAQEIVCVCVCEWPFLCTTELTNSQTLSYGTPSSRNQNSGPGLHLFQRGGGVERA